MKIAHIINVLEIKPHHEKSYLHIAQPITLDSMVAAKNHTQSDIDIELLALKHQDEKINIPSEFAWCKDLTRYCYDVFHNLPKDKKFPLVSDILNSLYNSSSADYFVYTNVDIGIFPNFYDFIKESIDSGLDAFTINRVRMPKKINETKIGPENYNLVFNHKGGMHMGFDCFVFRREYTPELAKRMGNIFIGAPPIGTFLKGALKSVCPRYKRFGSKANVTFHLGHDRAWQSKSNPYNEQNKIEEERLKNIRKKERSKK